MTLKAALVQVQGGTAGSVAHSRRVMQRRFIHSLREFTRSQLQRLRQMKAIRVLRKRQTPLPPRLLKESGKSLVPDVHASLKSPRC